jgi:hypothetical protein
MTFEAADRAALDLVSRMTLDEKLEQMAGSGIGPMIVSPLFRDGEMAPVYSGRNECLGIPPSRSATARAASSAAGRPRSPSAWRARRPGTSSCSAGSATSSARRRARRAPTTGAVHPATASLSDAQRHALTHMLAAVVQLPAHLTDDAARFGLDVDHFAQLYARTLARGLVAIGAEATPGTHRRGDT